MRHLKSGKKLGINKSHRRAMLSNMAVSLFEHKKIKTTFAKAKELRRFADRMVTFGKKNTVAARRHVYKFMGNHKIVKILFDEIAPTFSDRNGGYTRVLKLGNRPGDGSEMAIVELVGFHKSAKKKKKKEKDEKKKETEKTKDATVEQETEVESDVENGKEVKEKKTKIKKSAKKDTKEEVKKDIPEEPENESEEEVKEDEEKQKKTVTENTEPTDEKPNVTPPNDTEKPENDTEEKI